MTTSPPRPLRAGLVGFGLGGRVFHGPLLAATPGLELAAVVTGDPERQAQARARYPGVERLASAAALLERRSALGLDLVVISTPNRTHVPLARAALEAGLHVVVDKPFAPSSAEALELVALARRLGLLLTVFQNRRWDSDFLTVRRLIAEGALGPVARFESRFERWAPAPRAPWKERAEPAEAGGLLFDLGVHLIDQALVLFGPARAVEAELACRRPGSLVDDDDFVAIDHASGVRSELWMSKVARVPGPRFRVIGAGGAFVKDGLDGQEAKLAGGAIPGGPGWGAEPEGSFGLLSGDGVSRRVPSEPGDYPAFYRLLAAALRGGGPPPVLPEEAIAALEVIEAARRAVA